MSKWASEQIQKYEEFHEIAKRRLSSGESKESAYRDKPEGYSEWIKQQFKDKGGIRLPKTKSIPLYECWSCHKVYSGNKCPYCGAFKPK